MTRLIAPLLAAALVASAAPAATPPPRLALMDSFRVGNAGVLCTAQRKSEDPRFRTMFDRGYEVVCRDAATPVARLYVMHAMKNAAYAGDFAEAKWDCRPALPVTQAGETAPLAGATRRECTDPAEGLSHVIYRLASGKDVYASEGLAAYESVVVLGLRTLVADKPVPGEISVATTGAGDPAALARLQATRLDPEQALIAGYARSADGSFAEASETFATLVARARASEKGATRPAEYLANLALQQSILGNRTEAEALLVQAHHASAGDNRQIARLLRNMEVMHHLNIRDANGALALLDKPADASTETEGLSAGRLETGFIDRPIAQKLEIESSRNNHLGGSAAPLTDRERETLLDAQALYLRGVALRMKGNTAAAKAQLTAALDLYLSVRGGVGSMKWLDANVAAELAQIAEVEGNAVAAETYQARTVALFGAQYPSSATQLGARARLAGMEARHGKTAQAIATFRDLVTQASTIPGGGDSLRGQIGPYFDALVAHRDDPGSPADFFIASQAMLRPGVAQTQAVLARELSAGNDAASGLFRQSITLSRELVSLDAQITRLAAIDPRKPDEDKALETARGRRHDAAVAQTVIQAQLAAFPKYRAASNLSLSLADLQKLLRDDEAYYKVIFVDQAAYAILIRHQGASIFKVGASRASLEKLATTIRDSIVVEEGNQLTTDPFDVEASYRMFSLLFGPVATDLARTHHLVFEADGGLLKLPPTVLVTEKAGIDAYNARQKGKNPDAFDFSGIAWLGRNHIITTAVSAQSFVDVRNIAPSSAKRRYLGLGQNTPVAKSTFAPRGDAPRDPCEWALSTWNRPISGEELKLASSLLGGADNLVQTGEDFTDSDLRERHDLANFRIIQFATHGLVTAPHPGCPARPALVTSVGRQDSDGLLSFKEIFDLRLDADTVILSACDTAGAATAAATREAGITTGGNFALDGLVRAFVGAGARAVVASHWPVPDDYDATRKLMSVIYEGGTTRAVGESMRISQQRLMDDPLTSHPYYWAAFAIVGDAAKPLTSDLVGGGNARAAR